MKTVFTTGEAAKIGMVSQQTIIRCFDSGQLKGFRVPGSRFRRIPREQLYSFMRDNGIPTDALDNGKQVCQLVRGDKTMDDVRIICISGMVEEDRIQQLRDAGANDFIKKPFD